MNGPRIHEFLREMHDEVFAGREGKLLTVGEMPGVTIPLESWTSPNPRADVLLFSISAMDWEYVAGTHAPLLGTGRKQSRFSWS